LYFWYVTKIEIFLATQTLFLYAWGVAQS
jgi:hypothetical protein